MNALRQAWQVLGIAADSDVAAIRAAYARQLKSFDPDDDPERFAELRAARDQALAEARSHGERAAERSAEEVGALQAARDDARWSEPGDAAPTAPEVIDARLHGGDALKIAPPLVNSPVSGRGLVSVAPALAPEASYQSAPQPGHATDAEERVVPLPLILNSPGSPPVLDRRPDAGSADVGIVDHAAHRDRMSAHYDAVLALLFPPDDTAQQPLSDAEAMALNEHIKALLADPRLEEIAFLAEADRWFASVLADAVPRSDPAIQIAIDYFGWRAGQGRIDQHPAAAAVVARADEIDFLAKVTAPGHRLNAAWRELTRPADEGTRRGIGWGLGGKVSELIQTVRQDYPRLEGHWDWYRVSLWENSKPRRFNVGWMVSAIYLAIVAFGIIARALDPQAGGNPARNPVPAIVMRDEQVIDSVLAAVADESLTLERARKEKPELASLLTSNLKIARDLGHDNNKYARDMIALLADRIRYRIKIAPYQLSADRVRLRLAQAKAIMPWSWASCRDFIVTGKPLERAMSTTTARQERLMRVRILLETDGEPSRGQQSDRFSIPGEMVAKIAARAKLNDTRTRKALQTSDNADEPALKDQCLVGIALMEEALARPPAEAVGYLRNL